MATEKRTSKILLIATAVAIAAVAATFSLQGLGKIFPGSVAGAALLGAALEIAKLATASWMCRNWKASTRTAKVFAGALVTIAMIVNVCGVFGYLSSAHIVHDTDVATFGRDRLATLDSEITATKWSIENIDTQLTALNTATTAAATKGRINAVKDFQAGSKKTRIELTAQRTTEAAKLAKLVTTKTTVESKRKEMEAETGPLQYLASLFGTDDIAKTVRAFTLVLALLPDLFAIFLVMAAEAGQSTRKTIKRATKAKTTPKRKATAKIVKLATA